jgi:hypothetical protein
MKALLLFAVASAILCVSVSANTDTMLRGKWELLNDGGCLFALDDDQNKNENVGSSCFLVDLSAWKDIDVDQVMSVRHSIEADCRGVFEQREYIYSDSNCDSLIATAKQTGRYMTPVRSPCVQDAHETVLQIESNIVTLHDSGSAALLRAMCGDDAPEEADETREMTCRRLDLARAQCEHEKEYTAMVFHRDDNQNSLGDAVIQFGLAKQCASDSDDVVVPCALGPLKMRSVGTYDCDSTDIDYSVLSSSSSMAALSSISVSLFFFLAVAI